MSLPFTPADDVKLIEAAGPGGTLAFEADTGILRSLTHPGTQVDLCAETRADQLGQIGGIRIWDDLEKRWYDDFENPGSVSAVESGSETLSFQKAYDGCPFSVLHKVDASGDRVHWDLEISQSENVNRSLRVCYQVPIVAGWRYFAPCLEGHRDANGRRGHCEFDGMSVFNFMHHNGPYFNGCEITVPLFSMYDAGRDTGFQFAAPAHAQLPGLWFEFTNRGGFGWGSQRHDDPARYPHLDIIHNFIGIHGNEPCRVALEIYCGRGDYRPLLGQYVEAHRSYFYPKCEKIFEREGTFQCGSALLAEDDDERDWLKRCGLKYFELHGHFHHYGKYWNEGEWETLGKYERTKLARQKGEPDPEFPPEKQTMSQERLLADVKKLKEDGISVHLYFNFTDGDRELYVPHFSGDINKDEEGENWPSGWRFCDNIHARPGSKAFENFVEEARRMLEHYPADGFFFDCFRHFDFDFAYSDGITMINNKPASCVTFSMAKLSKAIMEEAHAKGKDSFANKPRTLLLMGDVDGMLLEGDGQRSEYFYYYTTLAKPNFYMWGHGVTNEEEMLKRAVLLAAWPRDPIGVKGEEAVALYSKYLPLYPYFTRKVFCFEPEPLRVPDGLEAELYTVGADYVCGVIRNHASHQDEPYGNPPKIALAVERADYVQKVHVHYAGEEMPREMPVYRAGKQIVVPLALLRSAAVVKLFVGEAKNEKQESFDAVTDYFDSCGDPVSAFQLGAGATEG